MTPQERQMVDDLFDRLSRLETGPRDAEAESAVVQGLRRAPNAAYALVQTVLVQDEALKRANARIQELEGSAPEPSQSGGFLDSMRGALLGETPSRGSVPSVRPGGDTGRPVWNSGQVLGSGAAPGGAYADPRTGAAAGGGGSSFLGTAAAAAAGMVGGSLLMNGIRGLMGGGHQQSFGDTASSGGTGSPWSSGDQSNSNLARDAGINDIGKSGQDDQRQNFSGNDRNDDASADYASHDADDDDDSDADDFDGGDSDYA